MNNYKIYALKEKNSIYLRYIGLTTNTLINRFKKHLRDKTITHKTNWINRIGKDNIEIILIEEHIQTTDELCEKEIYYINKFKKEGHKLTNTTLGGDGWFGMKFSDTHKQNISKNHSDVSGENNPMFGKNHTLEARDKIRNAKLNTTHSAATKDKMSLKKLGENNSKAVLSENDIIDIRKYYNSNKYTQHELADIFGVKQPAIYKIVKHITWKHVI
jgi:group I intron endonuclease